MPRVKKQSAKTLKQRKSRNYFSAKNSEYFDLCDYKLSDTQIKAGNVFDKEVSDISIIECTNCKRGFRV